MARLLLVRHAPTPETGTKLTGRLPGVGLGDTGRRAAQRTAERLSDLKLAAVYASPIERTWETAAIIAAPHGLQPVSEEGLVEVDYGKWSGRSLKSLSQLKAWWTVQVTPSRMTFPEGESLAAAQHRAVEACERLAAAHGKETIALVSHSDIIQSIVSHYLGQPLDLFSRIVISPTSVTVVDVPRQGIPRVMAVNTTGAEGSWR
ncbi:MAG TPA: histidine phosphatase family protein [Acidimicrobiia bacterium]|nr:histidine phosphatase family protein [Acidimicrobiia bacterium]